MRALALRVIDLWAVVDRDADWRREWNTARDALIDACGSTEAAWRAMREAAK